MKKKYRILLIILLAAAILTAGVFAVGDALSVPGSEEDPLITLSYLNEVFAEYVTELFRKDLDSHTEALQTALEERVTALEESSREARNTADWQEVTAEKGTVLTLSLGTEVILRSGSVSVQSGTISDTTDALEQKAGAELEKNHLCLASAETKLNAAEASALLIRGGHQIG